MERVLELIPDQSAEAALLDTVALYEEMASFLDAEIPSDATSNLALLHANWYFAVREKFPNLPSQMVTLGLRDWNTRRTGDTVIGIPYDTKLFSIRGLETVSIATVEGRFIVRCIHSKYQDGVIKPGQARLLVDGKNIFSLLIGVANDQKMDEKRIENMIGGLSFAKIGSAIMDAGFGEIVDDLGDLVKAGIHEFGLDNTVSNNEDQLQTIISKIEKDHDFLVNKIKDQRKKISSLEQEANKISKNNLEMARQIAESIVFENNFLEKLMSYENIFKNNLSKLISIAKEISSIYKNNIEEFIKTERLEYEKKS